ncbi:unnamed protein product [Caenorhabditis angaria]|uniref:Intraflagellar transport protein 43 homolog n=1 Tax=Caenorhabditis angaria TaxID=860376 RepID=A0A9P1IBF1_9PELO|nr:unnamed protein product [Caenorhabditis angaria]
MNRRKAIQENDDSSKSDDDLNFRVQDKTAIDPDTKKSTSRLGNILKDGGPIRNLKENAAETLKRPLTGLFRRPGSKAGGRKKEKEADDDSSQPPVNFQAVSKISSTLEDVILDDESDNDRKNGGASSRTNIGVEGISKAPNISLNKMNPMLGTAGVNPKLAYLFKLEHIDISILGRHLLPKEEITEEDVPWTWDHLYASLSTELREEWAADNERQTMGGL